MARKRISNYAAGFLAAGVAHEVNTPLAVISSYAQMLSKQLQGDPMAQAGDLLAAEKDLTRRADSGPP